MIGRKLLARLRERIATARAFRQRRRTIREAWRYLSVEGANLSPETQAAIRESIRRLEAEIEALYGDKS